MRKSRWVNGAPPPLWFFSFPLLPCYTSTLLLFFLFALSFFAFSSPRSANSCIYSDMQLSLLFIQHSTFKIQHFFHVSMHPCNHAFFLVFGLCSLILSLFPQHNPFHADRYLIRTNYPCRTGHRFDAKHMNSCLFIDLKSKSVFLGRSAVDT
jgi:hypothetical protein